MTTNYESYNEDKVLLPFQAFLDKYYADVDLSQWNRWMDRYINPAFVIQQREQLVTLCRSEGGPWYPDFDLLESYYREIKDEIIVDDELAKFMAYLAATGFLAEYGLSFHQWINIYNWHHPWLNESQGKLISEIIHHRYSDNYLKTILLQMPWWNMR